MALPLGLGGGTIDVALNNVVANHFKAFHMNWLHGFWGIGATLGPLIMAHHLQYATWRDGFSTISSIQLLFAGLLLAVIPFWARLGRPSAVAQDDNDAAQGSEADQEVPLQESPLSPHVRLLMQLPGVRFALAAMLTYGAVEFATGLWGGNYLVTVKGFSEDTAARYVSLYYIGITAGRFLSGFLAIRLNNAQMIRLGGIVALLGCVLMLLPLPAVWVGAGLALIGFGFAPVFPAMLHATPVRFGAEYSQRVIGYQMGFAYIGSAAVPPLLGLLFQVTSLSLYPIALLVLTACVVLCTEQLNRAVRPS